MTASDQPPGDRARCDDFLAFLDADIAARPEAVTEVTLEWLDEMKDLVEGVELDTEAPLQDDETELC